MYLIDEKRKNGKSAFQIIQFLTNRQGLCALKILKISLKFFVSIRVTRSSIAVVNVPFLCYIELKTNLKVL